MALSGTCSQSSSQCNYGANKLTAGNVGSRRSLHVHETMVVIRAYVYTKYDLRVQLASWFVCSLCWLIFWGQACFLSLYRLISYSGNKVD